MSIKPILVCECPSSFGQENIDDIKYRLGKVLDKDYYVIVTPNDYIKYPIFKTNHPDLYSLEGLKEIIK